MTILPPLPVRQFKDSNCNPLAGDLLYAYAAGTSTPQTTYQDVTTSTPNTNPIVLNSQGEAQIWLTPSLVYKFLLQDTVTLATAPGNTVVFCVEAKAAAVKPP